MSQPGVEGPIKSQSPEGVTREQVEAKRAELAKAISAARNAVAGSERAEKIQVVELLLQNWSVAEYGEPPDHFLNITNADLGLNTSDLVGANIKKDPVEGQVEEQQVAEKPKPSETEKLGERIRDWNVDARNRVELIRGKTSSDASDLGKLRDLQQRADEIDRDFLEIPLSDPANKPLIDRLESMERIWNRTTGRREEIADLVKRMESEAGIVGVEVIIDRVNVLLKDPAFRPINTLAEFGGKTALDVIADARLAIAGLRDTDSTVAKLSLLDSLLAERVFQQWKSELEANYPVFKDLREVIELARTSAGSTAPDFTLIARLETKLNEAQLAVEDAHAGADYTNYLLNNYWKPAEDALGLLKEAQKKASKEMTRLEKIAAIRANLSTLKEFDLVIELENDDVGKNYSPVHAEIEELIKTDTSAEALELKLLAYRQEFTHRCIAYSKAMVAIEKQMPSGAQYSKFFKEVIDTFVIARCGNIIKILQSLGSDTSYEVARLQELKDHYSPIVNLAFSWKSVRDPVLGVGAKRSVFSGGTSVEYNNENHPIKGEHITALVRGITARDIDTSILNIEGGNVSLGEKTVKVKSDRASAITNPSAVVGSASAAGESEVTFTETAMGWCMRLFDKVYQEKPIVVSGVSYDPITPGDGKKINGSNIHLKSSDLINFIYGIEEDRARRAGESPRFDKHLVERAFRLHITSTMNHSYLAASRASISDELYYMFEWLKYAPDYQVAGTGKFNILPTAFIFGFEGVSPLKLLDPAGNPKKDPNLEEGKGGVYAKMEAIMQEKGYLRPNQERFEENGFYTYKFMLQPFITLVDVNPESATPNNVVMNPPLRYYPIGYQPGTTRPLRVGGRADGLMLTLDDMRDTDGERLYELMDFDIIGELNGYYNQLGQNGLNFLQWFLRSEESEFLRNVDEAKINDMKNQAKFTLSLFPKIGNLIMWGEGSARSQLEKDAINRITVMLIFIKCLIMIDRSRPKTDRWDLQNNVNQFLINMFRRGVISEESKNVIFDMLNEAYKVGVYVTSLGDKLLKQVEERARVKV